MQTISRKAWGAAPPRGRDQLPAAQARGVAVHYSGANADEEARHANCAGRVRAIQRFHMEQNGWLDIAYGHLVCRHGYVFVGRGFGVRTAANGTTQANDHYFAACFLGNDTEGRADVTRAARRALGELIVDYQKRYPRATRVRPHSAFTATACPGRELLGYIDRREWMRWKRTWPVPLPRWFWAWARWRLEGATGPRPRSAPRRIPRWAWDRIARMRPRSKGKG